MTYLAILTIQDPKLNEDVRPEHLRYISRLYQDQKVMMAGPLADRTGGLVIYHNVEEPEARALAENDPVITSGARTLKLIPWEILQLPISQDLI